MTPLESRRRRRCDAISTMPTWLSRRLTVRMESNVLQSSMQIWLTV